MGDACIACDRTDCPTVTCPRYDDDCECKGCKRDRRDCDAHAVDWRARCLAAEQRLNAEINKAFAGPLCPRCGAVVLKDEIESLKSALATTRRVAEEALDELERVYEDGRTRSEPMEHPRIAALRAELEEK